MKKIDTFYRNSKSQVFYIHSSTSFKTCKACTESAKQQKDWELNLYADKVGENIDRNRIFSRFDNLYSRHDNMPR